MNTIVEELGRSKKFAEIIKNIENKKSPVNITGLVGVGIAQQIASMYSFTKKPICLVTYNEIQAQKLYENIKNFTDQVVLFPKKEIVTYDYVAESKDLPYQRIEALNQIVSKRSLIIVTTVEAVLQKIPTKDALYKDTITFKVGREYKLENIKETLVNLGYVRCDLIEGRGQFSIRGDIIDISITETTGLRIELWGDEIESIRNFNITTQRSTKVLEKAKVDPAHEFILEDSVTSVIERIQKEDIPFKNIVEEDIEQIDIRKLYKQGR